MTLAEGEDDQRMLDRSFITRGERRSCAASTGEVTGFAVGVNQQLQREEVARILFKMGDGPVIVAFGEQEGAGRAVIKPLNDTVIRGLRHLPEPIEVWPG